MTLTVSSFELAKLLVALRLIRPPSITCVESISLLLLVKSKKGFLILVNFIHLASLNFFLK